jgi:hypothetical protein
MSLQEFQPQILTDSDKQRTYQKTVLEVVFGYWNQYRRPIGLKDIDARFKERVRIHEIDGTWPYESWRFIDKRTIDRRVNELASLNPLENMFLEHGRTPKIVRVGQTKSDAYYRPNSILFEQAIKEAAT